MKRISVQAYEDRNQTDGGHAVLLLDGVMSIPDRLTIRLRSADANQVGADGTVWQDVEIVPLETRVSEQGIELVIGPDVAEDPALLAGAVMEIEIPEAGLKGEFLWPHITPRARPKRKNIAPNRPRRDTSSGNGSVRSEGLDGPGFSTEPHAMPVNPAASDTAGPAHASAAGAAPVGGGRAEPDQRSTFALRPAGALMEAHLKSLKNATSVPTLPLSLPLNDAGRSIVPFDRKTPASISAAASRPVQPSLAQPASPRDTNPAFTSSPVVEQAAAVNTPEPAEELLPPLIDPHGAHVNFSTALVLGSDPNDPNEPKAEENPWAWRKDVTAMLSTKFLAMGGPVKDGEGVAASKKSGSTVTLSGAMANSVAVERATPRTEVMSTWMRDNAEAGASYIKRANTGALSVNWTSYALGLGAAVALGALALQGAGKLPSMTPAAGAASTAAAPPGPFASVPPAGTFAAPSPVDLASQASLAPAGSLFDALSAAAVSPRGTAGAGVSALKALDTANTMLMAEGASRDAAEGAFWLKRYITAIIGEERNMRVVTQLGSLYAEPSGQAPDFEKARTLWEIASAAGDPVAMCFLGQLHENGLGVELDKKSALSWYEQSKQLGGCASVDEAIARVRN